LTGWSQPFANRFKIFPHIARKPRKTRHHITNHSANSLHACPFESSQLEHEFLPGTSAARARAENQGVRSFAKALSWWGILFPFHAQDLGHTFKTARTRGSDSVAVGISIVENITKIEVTKQPDLQCSTLEMPFQESTSAARETLLHES
jgi:hypothetical protein